MTGQTSTSAGQPAARTAQPDAEALLLRQDGAPLHVTFNRPERRNAINDAMLLAREHLVGRLERDSGVRMIVFRDAGGYFRAGGEMPLDALIDYAGRRFGERDCGAEGIEGQQAFLEKRKASWPSLN